MEIVECNVPVKSAAAFFSEMCAPDALARYYNPFGKYFFQRITVCDMYRWVKLRWTPHHSPHVFDLAPLELDLLRHLGLVAATIFKQGVNLTGCNTTGRRAV